MSEENKKVAEEAVEKVEEVEPEEELKGLMARRSDAQ